MPRHAKCSDAEWAARQELAATYRVFDHLGWSESIYNHITLRVPGEEGAFLINPFGMLYSEVCASNLIKIDIDGNKLDDSPYPVNPAGFVQHSYFHRHLPGAHAICHTHTLATMAVCSVEGGLRRNIRWPAGLSRFRRHHGAPRRR
jgi:ribulose-5-phosphate 4-epimerase/fuculose-1-phosphate aldolase